MATVRLELLGGFRMWCGDSPAVEISTNRLQALLAYLVINGSSTITRQHLAFLFWPDSNESQARTNLRQLLHHLRSALGDDNHFIDSDSTSLRLRADAPFTCDVLEFQSALQEANKAKANGDSLHYQRQLEAAIDIYRGDLLPEVYDEWLEGERSAFRTKYETALKDLLSARKTAQDYAGAIDCARRILAQDPLSEVAYQSLMRLHSLNQDRASMLRTYEECESVLHRELGVEPGRATRLLRDQLAVIDVAPPPPSASPAANPEGRFPLTGRMHEWDRLVHAWRSAQQGKPSLVLLKGDPGIGKTRLAEELLEWASAANTCTAKCACYATGARMSYAPLAEWLRNKSLRQTLKALPASQLTQLSRLMPELASDESGIESPEPLTEGWQRHQFFDSMARTLLKSGENVLLLIDDLHWCDNDTLDWLHYFLRFDEHARLLIAATVRPGEFDFHENLLSLVSELRRSDQVSEIDVSPLSSIETAALAAHVSGNELDKSSSQWLFEQTSGNPLFVVETVRAGMLEGRHRDPAETRDEELVNAGPARLPPKISAVLASRTSQLTEKARLLIRAAAILGKPFTARLIAQICQETEEATADALDELWRRRIIEVHGNGYRFTHERLREFAEAEAGPALGQLLHRRAADALAALSQPHDDSAAADIADHYEKAGVPEQAIPYFRRAAEVLQRRYAHAESARLLEKALSLCEKLPYSNSRDEVELSLLVPLGSSLIITRGYADSTVGRTYDRARLLSTFVGDSANELAILSGSWVFNAVRAQLQPSKQLALRLLQLGNLRTDCVLQATGHHGLGSNYFHSGELRLAQEHLEKALLLCGSAQERGRVLIFGLDVAVFCHSYLGHVLYLTGKQAEAEHESSLAIDLARELSQPLSLSLALAYAAMCHQFADQAYKVEFLADEAARLCREYSFQYYLIWTSILLGWAHTRTGSAGAGIIEMREGLAALRASGARLREPYYLGLIADAYLRLRQPEEGLACLAEASEIANDTNELWVQPELNRIRGELQLETGNLEEAEASLHGALRSARQIGANAMIPKIALRLADIWRERGKQDEARQLLATVLPPA